MIDGLGEVPIGAHDDSDTPGSLGRSDVERLLEPVVRRPAETATGG
jgi:hypothetical protein